MIIQMYILVANLGRKTGVFMARFFSESQLPLATKAFTDAEKLVSDYFRLEDHEFKKNKYDVKTLAYLDEHEIKDGAFAHLCKYSYERPQSTAESGTEAFDFYRVCLQDDVILNAVQRANPFVRLSPLMLYIAVHELIHVFRFGSGEADFDASREEKEREENIVHNLTKNTLQAVNHQNIDIVLECFSNNFKIIDTYSCGRF